MSDDWVAYNGRLTELQLLELKEEVKSQLYLTSKEVGHWIEATYKIKYHDKQVVKILHKLGFVYKKTKLVPGKARLEEQSAYVDSFEKMMSNKAENTLIFFNDGVHPQFNTKPEYGWIMRGEECQIPSQAGRQRLNISGAINAENPVELYAVEADAVNAQSMIALWEKIENAHPEANIVHVCDNAKYYKSEQIQNWLRSHPRTKVKFLPPYSPNLNPIERVWKLLKKEAINSFWYETFSDFRRAVMHFFENSMQWKSHLESLVTLNFRLIGY